MSEGGNIASRTYEVNTGRIELLFWKNEWAGYSKSISPTRSLTVDLWFVTHIDFSGNGVVVESCDDGASSDSRRSNDTPFLYDKIFLRAD